MFFVFYFQVLDECADFKVREKCLFMIKSSLLATDITKTEADSSVNEYIHWTYTYLKPLLCKFLALTPKFRQDVHFFLFFRSVAVSALYLTGFGSILL